MMSKIQMKTPLVEMDGDEMTRILWAGIKEQLLEPFVENAGAGRRVCPNLRNCKARRGCR